MKACNNFNCTTGKTYEFIWILEFTATCADGQGCKGICFGNIRFEDTMFSAWVITGFVTDKMLSNKITI